MKGQTLIAHGAPFLLLLAVFSPTLAWIWRGWFSETGYYSHGPLLVIACGAFLYAGRHHLRAQPRATSRAGTAALVCCLLAHVAGQALMVDSLSGVVFVPAILSFVWAREGPARLRRAAPAILCLLFAVPLPIFVAGEVAYAMKHVATAAAVSLGNLFGLGLEQSGARILIPGQPVPLVIGDACSGLRSLVALTSLGYVYAMFLTPRRWPGRLTFILLSVPVALAANFVRIAALAAIAKAKGVEFASGPAHDWSGYLLYLGAIVFLLGMDRILPGRRQRRPPPPLAMAEPGRTTGAVRIAALVATTVLGGGALALAIWHPAEDRARFAERVMRESEHFEAVRDHAFPSEWYDLIGTRDVCWRRYRAKTGGRVADLTAIFQGRKWKSLHPPQVCLISAGFEITDAQRRSLELGGRVVELEVLQVERGDLRYLVGFTFGNRGFATPSFLEFFWRNVPRALLRRDTRGYLIRVDVPWPQGTARSTVERVMARFLTDFLPHMSEVLDG